MLNTRHLSEQLYLRRRRRKWSQTRLAKEAHVSVPTVARIEREVMPNVSVEIVLHVAKALGVEIGDLIMPEGEDEHDADALESAMHML